MAELAFEALALGLESTRGTLIDPPTHYVPMVGLVTPRTEYYEPEESRGTLVRRYRQQAVRKFVEWTAEGGGSTRYNARSASSCAGASSKTMWLALDIASIPR
jgi:hypothetical protein